MKTCVLGLGKSGIVAARHAVASGDDVTVYAGTSNAAAKDIAAQLEHDGAKVLFDTEDVQGHFDQCIVSPGIPQTGQFYKNAKSACDELMSEPEYAWRLSPHGWIAVTGTNGKTTTTSLIAHILNESGKYASACGNIGDTALAAVENRRDGELLVVEMSSYQIASTSQFAPEVGVLLNITPDHLSWHGSFEAYAQAKHQMFANMGAGTTAVVCEGVFGFDELTAGLRARGAQVVVVSSTGALQAPPHGEYGCTYVGKDGSLRVVLNGCEHVLCAVNELRIKGSHNVENAQVAAAACIAAGCSDEDVSRALMSFTALEHRIEPCGSVGGVEFFNDSKGTNVDAALKALTAFEDQSVVLLLGGRDKGTDLSELVDACAGTCEAVICYGEAAERFYEAFAGQSELVLRAATMREAFEAACSNAQSGQVVLLSPACASFDEFDSYEQRGRVFKSYVRELAEREG